MIRTSLKLVLGCTLLVLGGCSSSATTKPSEGGEEVTQAAEKAPVIVEVVGRDQRIIVRSGATGPTYSLRNVQGETLVPAMTLQTMQAQHPDLARKVATMSASNDVGAWAGVE